VARRDSEETPGAGRMTVYQVHRPARVVHGPTGPERLEIEAPPVLPEGNHGSGSLQAILPALGMSSSLVMMLLFRGSAVIALGAVVLLVTVVGTVAMLLSQRGQTRRQRRQQRERYLDYLEELREALRTRELHDRALATVSDPEPLALFDVVRDPARRWERRRADRDFLRVRLGAGAGRLVDVQVADRGTPMTPTDPFMLAQARAVARRFGSVPQMPLTVPLDRVGNVSIVGTRADVLAVARALIVQIAALHGPDDVAIALAHPAEALPDWSFVKWLPHVLATDLRDGPVAGRRIATDPPTLAAILKDDLKQRVDYAAELLRTAGDRDGLRLLPRLVVIHDTHGQTAQDVLLPDRALSPARAGVTVLHLVADRIQEPGDVAIRIVVDGPAVTVEDLRDEVPRTTGGEVDAVAPALAEGVARLLAPIRLSPESVEDVGGLGPVDFARSLGIVDPARLPIERLWAARGERDLLRVPIGIHDSGEPLLLDLKEAAHLGMGPHGLCVGATGSGKSELLRTLVLALLTTHSPEQLSMVLVDYKGGATFAPFDGVPHVAGVITNLEDNAELVERVHTSLAGEVQRRQQILKDAGNIASIGDYAALRATSRPELAPVPHLLVIIDEFGELIFAKPDFIDLFLSIGRIGRSIGVHLLLSSQRIESGKLRGLETYLSYRLGLRTFSESESQSVLETNDAYHLPPLPGFGYLKVDTTVYERFKASYVSGLYRPPIDDAADDRPPEALPYPAFNHLSSAPSADGAAQPGVPARSAGPTVLDVMVRQLREAARPVQRIWLPPMPTALTLDAIAGRPQVTIHGLRLPRAGYLHVPLGILDDPARQRQNAWQLDLTVAGGHLAVIGGPRSGRTTLLRTLACSLALTHSPTEVSIYAVDLLGGALTCLTDFPHVGGVATRNDRERVLRTFEELREMLQQRELLFRERGIDSVERLRELHADGKLPELAAADVVLLIDGFGVIATEFEQVEPIVGALLQRGGSFGIHVVSTMLRWNEVRIALQSTFGTQLELRLGDASDSNVDRRLAQTIRADQPGRLLTTARLVTHVALPRVDGLADTTGLGEAVGQLARAVRATWHGPVAPRVRVLPRVLTPDDLPAATQHPEAVPVAVDETNLAPVLLDLFNHDDHLLVFGDTECGKTNLLTLIARGLVQRYAEDELVFGVVDPRRSLHGIVPDAYLGGYAHNPTLATGLANAIAQEMGNRVPNDPAAPRRTGRPTPRVVMLVDDYEVLTSAGGNVLVPLQPYLSQALDLSLHFVLARKVAGAARGLYDPVVQAIRESGATGIVMAGDRSEGQIFPGVYARAQPAGRGIWVRRGKPPTTIQTALSNSVD
jgi:DNA segregation ATPase FtsK/SpoIIIE, S-DNA-T family